MTGSAGQGDGAAAPLLQPHPQQRRHQHHAGAARERRQQPRGAGQPPAAGAPRPEARHREQQEQRLTVDGLEEQRGTGRRQEQHRPQRHALVEVVGHEAVEHDQGQRVAQHAHQHAAQQQVSQQAPADVDGEGVEREKGGGAVPGVAVSRHAQEPERVPVPPRREHEGERVPGQAHGGRLQAAGAAQPGAQPVGGGERHRRREQAQGGGPGHGLPGSRRQAQAAARHHGRAALHKAQRRRHASRARFWAGGSPAIGRGLGLGRVRGTLFVVPAFLLLSRSGATGSLPWQGHALTVGDGPAQACVRTATRLPPLGRG